MDKAFIQILTPLWHGENICYDRFVKEGNNQYLYVGKTFLN